MLWDNPDLQIVELHSDRRGLALALVSSGALPGTIRTALDLAGFDVLTVEGVDACLTDIALRKPDVVLYDLDTLDAGVDFPQQVAQARVTETLPILAISENSALAQGPDLSASSTETEVFLKLRALLRRERPIALRGKRQSGPFVLDEPGFRLSCDGAQADISKTDLCLLGPFFDVRDAVFDRQSLECLSFASHARQPGNRSIDVYISRMRRHVRAQTGIDPLRSIRGIGYALSER